MSYFFSSFCSVTEFNTSTLSLVLVVWWEKVVVNHDFNVQITILFISVLEAVLVESNWEVNSYVKIKIVLQNVWNLMCFP